MWRKVATHEEERLLLLAVDFTGNASLYGSWMLKVIAAWPIACEHNLTDFSQNRKAWVGHAAAQMAICCPEYITRSAWGCLTKQQRIDANNHAQHAIETWESKYDNNHGGQKCLRFF